MRVTFTKGSTCEARTRTAQQAPAPDDQSPLHSGRSSGIATRSKRRSRGPRASGGDADSICCLTGALAGARHGDDAIPTAWLANLRGDDPPPTAVLELADRVAAVVPRPVP
jgi:hypothetical protein